MENNNNEINYTLVEYRLSALRLATDLVASVNATMAARQDSPWIPAKNGIAEIADRYMTFMLEGRVQES